MKKIASRIAMLAFGLVVVGVIGFASQSATAGPPRAGGGPCGPRNCLDVWRPVICSNGVVYSNDCYAARACATGCTPFNQ